MSENKIDRREWPNMIEFFNNHAAESNDTTMARIEKKLDALTAALVKPQSSIILVGDDIARIAAEIARGAK